MNASDLAKSVDASTLVAGATEALHKGAHDHCEKLLDAALLIEPELVSAWTTRGALFLARGKPEVARASYERAVSLDDSDTLAVVTLVELLAQEAEKDPVAKNRAMALANWVLLEDIPPELLDRAAAVVRSLKTGAKT